MAVSVGPITEPGKVLHFPTHLKPKHVALRFNMIRDDFKKHSYVSIEYLPSKVMTAGTLIKPVGSVLFPLYHRRLFNNSPP